MPSASANHKVPLAHLQSLPRQQTRQALEQHILDAAETIFAERGFKGASMQAIADLAKLPKANLHYYFASKKNLYRSVLERIFAIWLEAAGAFEASDDPASALTSYVAGKMTISREHPAGSKVWAKEIMAGAPVIQDYLETTLVDWTSAREAAIQAWIEQGLISPIEPKHLLYLIWATTQHYADFQHQVETLNGGECLSDQAWNDITRNVTALVLRSVGLEPGTTALGHRPINSG